MIHNADGSFSSSTMFGMVRYATAEEAQRDEQGFKAWAQARAGRSLTERELRHGMHSDTRSDREQRVAKQRRQELFNPPSPADSRLPEEIVADDAERKAEEARRAALPAVERHALEAREKAEAARKASDLDAERDRIRATTEFAKAREKLIDLKCEVAFDPNASFALLEEIDLQIDLLDNKLDVLAAREAVKVLKQAARKKTEDFLSQPRHVDVAKARLEKYRDLPFDVHFTVERGEEIAHIRDPQTDKRLGISRAEYERKTPEQVHALVNGDGYTPAEMAAIKMGAL